MAESVLKIQALARGIIARNTIAHMPRPKDADQAVLVPSEVMVEEQDGCVMVRR